MAVELRNLLGKTVGQNLPATITFDHPSVAALVDHLAVAVFAAELADAPGPAATSKIPGSGVSANPNTALDGLTESELAMQLMSQLDQLGTQEKP